LERADERANTGEAKISELEEELQVVSNNVKSLEVSEEKSIQKQAEYEDLIRSLTGKLQEVSHR
jgi:tropomyosin-1